MGVAYSWRRCLTEDGRECTLRRYPWVIFGKPALAREVFIELAHLGVFEDGSSIIRDRMHDIPRDLCHIDTSEMMIRRAVLAKVPLREVYTARDRIYQLSEDFMFCRDAQDAGVVFAGSERVTLNYYLGGQSSGSASALEAE